MTDSARQRLMATGHTRHLEPRPEGWFPWPHQSLDEYHAHLIAHGESPTHEEVWKEPSPTKK